MCIPGLDPMTLLSVIGGVGAAASGIGAAFSSPPEAKMPATPAIAREAGAKIKIGTQDGMDEDSGGGTYVPPNLRRSSGRSIGGLGRGGLAL